MADPALTLSKDHFDGAKNIDKSSGNASNLEAFVGRLSSRLDEAIVVVNQLKADKASLYTALASDKTVIDSLKTQVNVLVTEATELKLDYTALLADVTAMRTALSAHTHGGVTVGAGTTSAMAALDALTATGIAAADAAAVSASTATPTATTATAAATATGITVP